MAKTFNVNGACRPSKHYMVNLKPSLEEIKEMVEAGEYFTINRARQYGKTTLLRGLADFLKEDYFVASMDFQRMGESKFKTENLFSVTFAQDFIKKIESGNELETEILDPLKTALREKRNEIELYELFDFLTEYVQRLPNQLS